MSPTKQVKVTKKPVVQPNRRTTNPETSKRAWAVNSGMVISSALFTAAQCASLLGVQHAAQAVSMVFNTIEVCGGTSFNLCIET